jgi:hypothetical protein
MLSEKMQAAVSSVRGGSSVRAAAAHHGVNKQALSGACDALQVARPGKGRGVRTVQKCVLGGNTWRVLVSTGGWRYVRTDRSADGVITLTEATKGEYDAQE